MSKLGIECRVLSFHTVKPLDKKAIVKAARETKGIMTVEEHFLAGGFGSAVAEFLADEMINVPFVRLGISDEFPRGVGSQDYFLNKCGLTSKGIIKAVNKILNRD